MAQKEKDSEILQDNTSPVTEKNPNDKRPSYLKKRVIIPTTTAILLILLGGYFLVHSIFYQSTDDAFVEGHIVSVAPRVSGPVEKMLITDNQPVKKGDLLIVIDSSTYEVKLAQSKAKLNEANANLKMVEKDIISTNSKLDFAKKDFERYSLMYDDGATSKQNYESSKNNLTVAEADYNSALAKKDSINAQIEKLEASVKEDELNLSYTKIYAPQDGLITSRSVEQGNYLQIAQPMFSIVPEKVWVVANFKETQLTNIKIGQPVNIKIDTYPNKKFKGKVDSIQRATGAKASLFPPENAVGSYVKIVQRIPVKILFEEDISKYNIVPGMSVVPEVKVR